MPNDSVYLDDAILEDALRRPYYFNGRLLTQEDLTEEQAASGATQRYLGQSLGTGVAHGLEVVANLAASAPRSIVLDVAGGLAVAPNGEVLHVPNAQRLRFVPRSQTSGATLVVGEDFTDCGQRTSVPTAKTGLYLLVIRPVMGKQGRAAVSGLGNEAAKCNSKHRTRGVSFRALPLDTSVSIAASDPRFRSAFALECFGFFQESLLQFLVDPFAQPAPLETGVSPSNAALGYGKVDALRRAGQLLDCEVPLAVVRVLDDGSGGFVDQWPVRRALVRPALSRHWWPFGGSDDRRRYEAQAAMFCFQDHVADLLGRQGLASVAAAERFAFLPGGGFLPVHSGGFDPTVFLGNADVIRDADFGRLRVLVEESWNCEPINLLSQARPPLSCFAFGEAPDWVFFLRRRKESYEVPPPPGPGGSDPTSGGNPGTPPTPGPGSSLPPPTGEGPVAPPTTPPAGSSPPPTPETPGTLSEREVIVVVTSRWLKRFGNAEILVTDDQGKRLSLPEVDPTDAEKLLKKAFFQDAPGPRRRRGEPVPSPLDRYQDAQFYVVKGPATPNIQVVAKSETGTTPLFSERFSTTPGGVLVAVLS